jgi:hypothetical protein
MAQICKRISKNYSCYSFADDGWQASVGERLGLNTVFILQEKSENNLKEGGSWTVRSGMEQTFTEDTLLVLDDEDEIIPSNSLISSSSLLPWI